MNNLGLLYYEQQNKDMAVKYLKSAVDNGYYNASLDLGIIYGQLGDKDNSEKYLLLSLDKAKNNDALYHLGVLYYDQGKKDLAVKYLKQASANGDKDAKSMLDSM